MSYRNAEEIQAEIDEAKERLEVLESNDNESEYDDLLDQEGDVQVAGLTFSPSQIVKEMDPTAYRCGMDDWNDNEITELNEKIEALESELKDVQAEESAEMESEAGK